GHGGGLGVHAIWLLKVSSGEAENVSLSLVVSLGLVGAVVLPVHTAICTRASPGQLPGQRPSMHVFLLQVRRRKGAHGTTAAHRSKKPSGSGASVWTPGRRIDHRAA